MDRYKALLIVFSTTILFSPSSAMALEKREPPPDAVAGKIIFIGNCGYLCHGFDGAALIPYGGVPSFSKGERLDKSNKELMKSVRNGVSREGQTVWMPSWKMHLSDDEIRTVIFYIRYCFEIDYEAGLQTWKLERYGGICTGIGTGVLLEEPQE